MLRRLACANRCFLCKESEETIDHLLFIMQRLECSWSHSSLFWSSLGNSFLNAWYSFALERVFHCKRSERSLDGGFVLQLLGGLETRNDILFRNEASSLQNLKYFCTSSLVRVLVGFSGWFNDHYTFHD